MKERYQDIEFRAETLRLIEVLDGIISEYQAQGYVLNVRQLYYQMVARAFIENTLRSYKRLASVVNDARLAGLLDWDAIEDRTREFVRRSRWAGPGDLLRACAEQYHEDMWADQEARVFVVVEKEALVGVLEPVCRRFDVPLLAARGYPSCSVLREFALEDIEAANLAGQDPVVLHLGDHDPSGIDMSRDLEERLRLFQRGGLVFKRIALNMSQVEELRPPENPAKVTDTRYRAYMKQFGTSSWELDALSPEYLAQLVTRHVNEHINVQAWAAAEVRIKQTRSRLAELAGGWAA